MTTTQHDGTKIKEHIPSITEMFDQISSKRKAKVSTVVLHVASNAGKSIVLRSAFKVYPDCAMMYQGTADNFMFQQLEASVFIWEEALFAEHARRHQTNPGGGGDIHGSKILKACPSWQSPNGYHVQRHAMVSHTT